MSDLMQVKRDINQLHIMLKNLQPKQSTPEVSKEFDTIKQAFYIEEGNDETAEEIKNTPKHKWTPTTKEGMMLYAQAYEAFKTKFIKMIYGLIGENEMKLSKYHHSVLHSAEMAREWLKQNATKAELYPYQVYDDIAIALYKYKLSSTLSVPKPELLAGRIPCLISEWKPMTEVGANIVKMIEGLKQKEITQTIQADAPSVSETYYDIGNFGKFAIRDGAIAFTDNNGRFMEYDNFIPCTIWNFREEMKADKAEAEAARDKALQELEEETKKKLEVALEGDKKKIEKHRSKHERQINSDYNAALREIDNYYGKMIVKDDDKLQRTENYVDPIDINNYQGRFVQLVPDKRGLVKKSADGTFRVTLAYKPNPLVIGVVDGFLGEVLKVYDSGFHEVVTQGLKEVKTGDFICPSDDYRGHVKYVNKSLGAVDDIDKFRIPIGKIIGVEETESGEETLAITTVLCKLCD